MCVCVPAFTLRGCFTRPEKRCMRCCASSWTRTSYLIVGLSVLSPSLVWPNFPGCSPRATLVKPVDQRQQRTGMRLWRPVGATPSCWKKRSTDKRCKGDEGRVNVTFVVLSRPTQQPFWSRQPRSCYSLLSWSLWFLWRPVSAGPDVLIKPSGPQAAREAPGQRARPKLTQLMFLV